MVGSAGRGEGGKERVCSDFFSRRPIHLLWHWERWSWWLVIMAGFGGKWDIRFDWSGGRPLRLDDSVGVPRVGLVAVGSRPLIFARWLHKG